MRLGIEYTLNAWWVVDLEAGVAPTLRAGPFMSSARAEYERALLVAKAAAGGTSEEVSNGHA